MSDLRAAFVLSFPGRDHRLSRLVWIVREQNEIEIAWRDLLLAGHAGLQPPDETRPVVSPEHDHRELIDLSRLNEGERLEAFVERAETAGEDDERVRVFDEHRLPDEEI